MSREISQENYHDIKRKVKREAKRLLETFDRLTPSDDLDDAWVNRVDMINLKIQLLASQMRGLPNYLPIPPVGDDPLSKFSYSEAMKSYLQYIDSDKGRDESLFQSFLSMKEHFPQGVIGEDFYPGQSNLHNRANMILTTLLEAGFMYFEDEDHEEGNIFYNLIED